MENWVILKTMPKVRVNKSIFMMNFPPRAFTLPIKFLTTPPKNLDLIILKINTIYLSHVVTTPIQPNFQ